MDNAEERDTGVYAKMGRDLHPGYRNEEEGMVAWVTVGRLHPVP